MEYTALQRDKINYSQEINKIKIWSSLVKIHAQIAENKYILLDRKVAMETRGKREIKMYPGVTATSQRREVDGLWKTLFALDF